jgi:hypothetical protein
VRAQDITCPTCEVDPGELCKWIQGIHNARANMALDDRAFVDEIRRQAEHAWRTPSGEIIEYPPFSRKTTYSSPLLGRAELSRLIELAAAGA